MTVTFQITLGLGYFLGSQFKVTIPPLKPFKTLDTGEASTPENTAAHTARRTPTWSVRATHGFLVLAAQLHLDHDVVGLGPKAKKTKNTNTDWCLVGNKGMSPQ